MTSNRIIVYQPSYNNYSPESQEVVDPTTPTPINERSPTSKVNHSNPHSPTNST